MGASRFATLVLAGSLATAASAEMAPVPLDQRSGQAERIAVGRVVKQHTYWAGDGAVTASRVEIAAWLKGASREREVVVLAPPVEAEHARVLAFLADEESWSSSALALALATSQRTVQRALDSLAAAGKVQSFGRGRARRWMTPPIPGFTTTLLLPASLPGD